MTHTGRRSGDAWSMQRLIWAHRPSNQWFEMHFRLSTLFYTEYWYGSVTTCFYAAGRRDVWRQRRRRCGRYQTKKDSWGVKYFHREVSWMQAFLQDLSVEEHLWQFKSVSTNDYDVMRTARCLCKIHGDFSVVQPVEDLETSQVVTYGLQGVRRWTELWQDFIAWLRCEEIGSMHFLDSILGSLVLLLPTRNIIPR